MGTLRYVNSLSGMNVRDDAAGDAITRLKFGDLMYEIDPLPVRRALNGVVYNWLFVYFYKDHNTSMQGYGWVAQEYTLELPVSVPSLSDTFSSNVALPLHQSFINAHYIFMYLKSKGWSDNAIFGMLGNMEDESYINPGKWQDFPSNPPEGYGLVQWDPATYYTSGSFAGTNPGSIKNQLDQIVDDVTNGQMWMSNLHSPQMSFETYTTSNLSPESLSEYFARCYERPGLLNIVIPRRKTNARKWYSLFDEM